MLNCISTEAIKRQMLAYTDADAMSDDMEGAFLHSRVPCYCSMYVNADNDWYLTLYHFFSDATVIMTVNAVDDNTVGIDTHYTYDDRTEDFDYAEIDMRTTDRQLLDLLGNKFASDAATVMEFLHDDMTD